MKFSAIRKWLSLKWNLVENPEEVSKACALTFATPQGEFFLNHLLDNVYCTVYEGTDPIQCMAHNAQRALVHQILQGIDGVQNRSKYTMQAVNNMLVAQNGELTHGA